MNKLKKKRAVIIYVILLIIFFPLFIGLGYAYSHYSKKYEIVYVGKPVSSLNYNTQSGDIDQIATPLIEGAIVTSLDFSDFATIKDENLEDAFNSYTIDENNTDFALLNENEKALVILAQTNSDGMKKAKEIIDFYRPITFIGDDTGEDVNTMKNIDADSTGTSYPAYAMGLATEIYTNSDYTSFRIRLMDGSENKDKVARWSNGDQVTAEDVAFGTSRQMIAANAARGAYMLGLSGIRGMDAAVSADGDLAANDKARFDANNDGVSDNKMSVGYGLTPNARKVFDKLDSYSDFNSVANEDKGIVYHDSKNPSDSDYSFIQYNLGNISAPVGSNTFPTMLSSQSYLPIDMTWFQNKFGMTSKMNGLGISADTFLSNGPYSVTYFDNLYGYTFKKNEYYHDKELSSIKSGAYRFLTEPSTEIAMFTNGEASAVEGQDATAKVLMENKEVSKWVKAKFSSPQTRYFFFNLGTDNQSENSKFTKDPNFRRAIWYAFDRTTYHKLAGLDTTQPTSIFNAKGMYSDTTHGDFVDYAANTTYNVKGQSDSLNLETYNVDSRVAGLEDPAKNIPTTDPNRNVELSNYYFEKFLDDMDQLGVAKPTKDKQITLQYITTNGDKDPYYKTLQEKVTNDGLTTSDGLEIASYVDVYPITVTSATFWNTYYSGQGYDMASIKWLPDYLDIWSMIGIFNKDEISRGSNATASWNFWDGSDYTLENPIKDNNGNITDYQYEYGSKEKDDLARSLFDDGLASFYEGNSNVDLTSIQNSWLNSTDIQDVADLLAKAVIKDNTGIEPANTADIQSYFTNYSTREALTSGINHDAHTTDIWSSYTVPAYLLLETILKDGGTTIVGASETGSITPSRIILSGDPVIGYETWLVGFDLNKIKSSSYWYESRNQLQDILTPK